MKKDMNELIKMLWNANTADEIAKVLEEHFLKTNWTPILDHKTEEPLKIGDKVVNERGLYGYLQWDDFYNRYYIRSETGGNIVSNRYSKVKEIKGNQHDTSKIECRSNPRRKKW